MGVMSPSMLTRGARVFLLVKPGTGGTWSYGPPPSSNPKKKTESFHDGLNIKALMMLATCCWPVRMDSPDPGCSLVAELASINENCGKVLFCTSVKYCERGAI